MIKLLKWVIVAFIAIYLIANYGLPMIILIALIAGIIIIVNIQVESEVDAERRHDALLTLLKTIQMNNDELLQGLQGVSTQLDEVKTGVDKIGANNTVAPAIEAAFNEVKSKSQGVADAVKAIADQIPDAPPAPVADGQ